MTEPNQIGSEERWTQRHLICLIGVVAAAVALTWRGWYDLGWLAFNDEEASHLMLVPMVGGYLIWQRWDMIVKTPPRLGIIGPITLILGVLAWEGAYRMDHRFVDHIGTILVFAGVLACFTGDRFVLRFFPLFVLIGFLIPPPITFRLMVALPLQQANAAITHEILAILGLPIVLYGSVLEINGAQVGVAEACNGMRSIMAVILVCYAMAFATKIRFSAQILLLLLAPFIALAANIIRLLLTVLAYGYGEEGLADMLHDLLGWATIGVSFGFVWGVITLARWLMIPIDAKEKKPSQNDKQDPPPVGAVPST